MLIKIHENTRTFLWGNKHYFFSYFLYDLNLTIIMLGVAKPGAWFYSVFHGFWTRNSNPISHLWIHCAEPSRTYKYIQDISVGILLSTQYMNLTQFILPFEPSFETSEFKILTLANVHPVSCHMRCFRTIYFWLSVQFIWTVQIQLKLMLDLGQVWIMVGSIQGQTRVKNLTKSTNSSMQWISNCERFWQTC